MKITAFDTRLLPEAKKRLQALTTEPIIFMNDRCATEQEFIKQTKKGQAA